MAFQGDKEKESPVIISGATTDEGQLEPARSYTSRQNLRFVREIAERSRITTPDPVSE